MVLLKTKIVKVLFKYHLFGTVLRKQCPDLKFITEIYLKGHPAVITLFSQDILLILSEIGVVPSIQSEVIHDESLVFNNVKILQTGKYIVFISTVTCNCVSLDPGYAKPIIW